MAESFLLPSPTSSSRRNFKAAARGQGKLALALPPERIKSIRLKPRQCQPLPESLDAIEQADAITFGPGSLYTSIIPNLLGEGVPGAVARSKAVKIYICNMMWQPGETEGYTAADHVRAIHDHAKQRLIDYVVVNSQQPPPAVRRRYAKQNAWPVAADVAEIESLGVPVISASLLAEAKTVQPRFREAGESHRQSGKKRTTAGKAWPRTDSPARGLRFAALGVTGRYITHLSLAGL